MPKITSLKICPTTPVFKLRSSSIENEDHEVKSKQEKEEWSPPPAIPEGFEFSSSDDINIGSNNNKKYKMITFALGKIFCYSCIGNITECVRDEVFSSSFLGSNNNNMKVVAVTATRVPQDLLAIVVELVDCEDDCDDEDGKEQEQEFLWKVVNTVFRTVSGKKCGEKLICLMDRHPLSSSLNDTTSSSIRYFVFKGNPSASPATTPSPTRREFYIETDIKAALELCEKSSSSMHLHHNQQQQQSINEAKLASLNVDVGEDQEEQEMTPMITIPSPDDHSNNNKNNITQQKQQNVLMFVVEGMSCASCARNIENTLNKRFSHKIQPDSVTCSFATCSASVEVVPSLSEIEKEDLQEQITTAIKALGFRCTALNKNNNNNKSIKRNNNNNKKSNNDEDVDDEEEDDENQVTRRAIERKEEIQELTRAATIAIAGGLPLLFMMIAMVSIQDKMSSPFFRTMNLRLIGNFTFMNFIGLVLSTPVVWISGRPFFRRAWNNYVLSSASSSSLSITAASSSSSSPFQSACSSIFEMLSNSGMNMDTLVAVGVGISYISSIAVSVIRCCQDDTSLLSPSTSTTTATMNNNATTGSFSYHHTAADIETNFDTAAVLLAFVCAGKLMEAKAKRMTGDALLSLMKIVPRLATVIINTETMAKQTVQTKNLQINDLVEVLPGDNVPTDGVIVDGRTEIGEALVTGESLPVRKEVGSTVIGGTQNLSDPFIFKVTKVGKDKVVSNILQIVRTAQQSKPTILRVTDKIAAVFVPIVLLLALLVLFTWIIAGYTDLYPAEWRRGMSPLSFAFSFALATVVVACPCALGLAAPTAIMVGTGVGAQHGILLKSAEAMERAKAVNCVVFDKTGTLTTGKMTVRDIQIHHDLFVADNINNSINPSAGSSFAYSASSSTTTAANMSVSDSNLINNNSNNNDDENVVFVNVIGRSQLKRAKQSDCYLDPTTLMNCVAAIEGKSLHPIAKAIVDYAATTTRSASTSTADAVAAPISQIKEWTQIPGRGIAANVKIGNEWKRIAVGNLKFLEQDEKCENVSSEEAILRAKPRSALGRQSPRRISNNRKRSNSNQQQKEQPDENGQQQQQQQENKNTESQQQQQQQQQENHSAASAAGAAEVVVCVAVNRKFMATIHLADSIKPNAQRTVAYLRHVVGAQVWMVTGDTAETAKAVAEQIGISPFKVVSNRLPHEKVEAVRGLQEERGRKIVAFVGDGINDAAALTQSNLGIALGAGTDVAIDAADAVLVQDDLFNVCTLLDLANTTIRRIYINFLWAVVYNLVMLPLSCGAFFYFIRQQLPPVVAGAAMMFSSLSVVCSSLMLKLYEAPKPDTFESTHHSMRRSHRKNVLPVAARVSSPPPSRSNSSSSARIVVKRSSIVHEEKQNLL